MSRSKRTATVPAIASREKAAVTGAVVDPHDHLRRVDERLREVIERAGPCPLPERSQELPDGARSFRSLVNAIVSQQLSGKAAETIFGRLEALGGGTLPGPAELLAIPDETLRAAGLSGAKTRGVKDLAARVIEGALDLDRLHTHDDEAVIERLTQVKGIGRWTAEMFLMFRLGRPDVLSTADLGLRKGLMMLCGLRELPDPRTMERLTEHWRPFRSVGSWYLWRVAEQAAPAKKKSATATTKVVPGRRSAGAKKAANARAASASTTSKKAPASRSAAKKATAKKRAAQAPERGAQPPAQKTSRSERVLAKR